MRLKDALKALKDKRDSPNGPKVPENVNTDPLYGKDLALRDIEEAFEECCAVFEKLSLVKQFNFNLQAGIDNRLDMIERAMDRMYMLLPDPTAEARFKEAVVLYRARLMDLALGRAIAELPKGLHDATALQPHCNHIATTEKATDPNPQPNPPTQEGLF